MSHGITSTDHAFYGGRIPAWHRLGTVIDQDVVTAKEAMSLAQLDWDVRPFPVFAHVEATAEDSDDFVGEEHIDIPGRFCNVRTDTGAPLGIVGERYEIVQNRDAFDFFDDLIGKGDAHYHTAGSLYGGRKVWMLARLNRDILIGGDPDEAIDPFVCLVNGHDGNTAVTVVTTPIRVVCQNTLQWSLKAATNCWKGRHTANITQQARAARDVLGFSNDYFDQLQTLGDALITQSITTNDFQRMLDTLVPIPEIQDGDNTRGKTIAENTQAAIHDAWLVDNIANVRYSKWGFVQAVAEYVDWSKKHRDDDRFVDRNLLGGATTRTLKDRSVDVALNY